MHSAVPAVRVQYDAAPFPSLSESGLKSQLFLVASSYFAASRRALNDNGFIVLPKLICDAFSSSDQITTRVHSFDGDRAKLWERFIESVRTPAALARTKLTHKQNRMFYGIWKRFHADKDVFKSDFRDIRFSTKVHYQ